MKLTGSVLYEIDGESYSLEELREFKRVATHPEVLEFIRSRGGL